MKVIELFNRNLNKSTIESIDSTTFKEQINLLLNSTLVRLSGKEKAIVIGAGKMNDFSLSFFVKNFEETVLTDVDLLSVNESVRYERLSKKENDRLTRIRIEYTGFEINHFFSDFKERIVNCHSYDKLEKVIKSKLDGLENYKFLKDYEGKADFIDMCNRLTERTKQLNMEIVSIVQNDNVIILEWIMTMIFKKYPSTPLYGCTKLKISDDNYILEQRDYYDLWGDIFNNIPRFGKMYRRFLIKKFG